MGFKKNNPDCNCCGGTTLAACELFSDVPSRADSGTIGNDWTETAGTWDIASNTFQTTSANARLTRAMSGHQVGAITADGFEIKVRMKSSASGDKLLLIWNGVANASVRLIVGTGAKIELVNSVDSGETIAASCDVTAATSTFHEVRMVYCKPARHVATYQGAANTAQSYSYKIYLNGTLVITWTASNATSPSKAAPSGSIGIGTGGTLTGTANFDNYEILTYGDTNEVQQIVFTNYTAGNTKITFDGQQTANIAWQASAATVLAALEALSNLAPGDISVGSVGVGTGWTVTITWLSSGTYGLTDVPEVTVDSTGLTAGGGGGTVTITTQPDGQHCAECGRCDWEGLDRDHGTSTLVLDITNMSGTACDPLIGTYSLAGTFSECNDLTRGCRTWGGFGCTYDATKYGLQDASGGCNGCGQYSIGASQLSYLACQCYELSGLSIDVGTPIGAPAGRYVVTKLVGYYGALPTGSPGTPKLTFEFLDARYTYPVTLAFLTIDEPGCYSKQLDATTTSGFTMGGFCAGLTVTATVDG